MDQRNMAVKIMIQQLQDAFDETLDALYDLPEDYLQEGCGHACAPGGSARDRLVHNIFHEKQHTGQVWNIRDELRLVQGWGGRESVSAEHALGSGRRRSVHSGTSSNPTLEHPREVWRDLRLAVHSPNQAGPFEMSSWSG